MTTTPIRANGESPMTTSAKRLGKSTRRRVRRSRVNLLVGRVLLGLLLVAIWWAASSREWVNPLLVPRPSSVVDVLVSGLVDGLWWEDIRVTLTETLVGFVCGTAAGGLVGAVFAFVPAIREVTYPYVLALMSFPKLAIAPLLIVALGYGSAPKAVIAALLAFFPVMTSATAGLTEIDPIELRMMRSIGASKWQELRTLRLPNAMSYIFPALDVALIGALLGAVTAELIGAQAGLGYVLTQGETYGDTATIYGVLFTLAAIGMLLHTLIGLAQRHLPMSVVPK